MNLINRIKVGWKNEEFSKIRKYIRKPAYITFAIAGSIMTLAIIFWQDIRGLNAVRAICLFPCRD
mgnify:CR=1 FL=1